MNSDGCTIPDIKSSAQITPAGMMIEPYGEHSFSELKKYYSEQVANLQNADSFLLTGMTLMSDLRAALLACGKTGKPVYAVINIDEEQRTTNELPADAALITLQSMGLSAFGITAENEDILVDAVCRLVQFSKIPVFADFSERAIKDLEKAGVTAELKGGYIMCSIPSEERETALMLANERQAFFLEHATTEISDPIPCEANMDEILCDISQEPFDVLKIEINTPDDAMAFIQDAHMATLPVMFSCEDDISLMLVLMLYQGRALIDSECTLNAETIEKATKKYGSVVY